MKMLCTAVIVAATTCTLHTASAQELLTNGGFETGDFTGWTTTVLAGSNGDIFVTDLAAGDALPLSPNTAAGPASGDWYAAVDQSAFGGYAIEQSFTVDPSAIGVFVSFEVYANDTSGLAPFNSGLFDLFAANIQYARVDLLDSAGALVTNLFDAVPNPSYTGFGLDATGLLTPGDTYSIRFEHVDNAGFFHSAIDSVSVFQTVPAPGVGVLAACAGAALFRRRRG